VARVLIVGGGCRGRDLARGLAEDGHAVRITTRTEAGRAAIEAVGAECFVGTPDRIASLRYALEGVTLVCWLLGSARGEAEVVAAVHGSRLDSIVGQIVDTTVRGFVYEAAGTVAAATLEAGAGLVAAKAELNRVPVRRLDADPVDREAWLAGARAGIDDLLAGLESGAGGCR
jgi:nucleoside-diphosphate-sugar epimerase